MGNPVNDVDSCKPGDLIFFKHSKLKRVGHVGMIVECDTVNHNVKFIHATRPKVKISTYPDNGYYSRQFVAIKRIIV